MRTTPTTMVNSCTKAWKGKGSGKEKQAAQAEAAQANNNQQ
jgi:hypothetical protein